MSKQGIVKLKDLCITITDGSHYSPKGVQNGIPMLSVKDMRNNGFDYAECKYISREDYENLCRNSCHPEKNDILIAKDGSYLKEIFVVKEEKEEAILSSIGILKPNLELVDPYYIKYYLSSDFVKEQVAKKYVSGSALPRIILKNFANIEIPYIDIEKQKRIIHVLKTIDDKIESNNKIISELEIMAKTIYDYWFLQYEFPNEEGKPYKSSGGKMVYNEELKKEIPEGWSVKSIKDCIEHINTGLNPRDNFVLGNGNIKYITVKNLTKEGIINYDGCDVIDEKAKEIVHNRSDVDVGDILFASIAPLGRCFMVQEYPDEWDINESVFCIRPNQNVISTEYLYLYFTSESFIKQAENSSTGSIFSGIRINTLESIKLLVPNENVKELFSHSIKNIFLKKYKIAKENEELTKLRDELLPLLMNGQVSLKN